jgi:hypothetical protein
MTFSRTSKGFLVAGGQEVRGRGNVKTDQKLALPFARMTGNIIKPFLPSHPPP